VASLRCESTAEKLALWAEIRSFSSPLHDVPGGRCVRIFNNIQCYLTRADPQELSAAVAKDFLRARKSPERMQTFTNTVLAETFQQAGATKTDVGDPVKDAEGVLKDVRMGRKTWFEAVLENGYDPTTQLQQIALFNKLVDKFEIILDSDPRNTTLRGQEQPAETEERTPSSKAAPGKPKGQGFAALSEEDLGMVRELLVAGISRSTSWESTSRLYRG
jgi:hypothetical protein